MSVNYEVVFLDRREILDSLSDAHDLMDQIIWGGASRVTLFESFILPTDEQKSFSDVSIRKRMKVLRFHDTKLNESFEELISF